MCLILTTICLAGFKNAKAQLTVFAGPQISSAKYTIRGTSQPTENEQGFMGGVGLRSLIEGPVYFSPMLYYSKKGYDVTFNKPAFPPDSAALKNKTSIHTIELAPLVQINFSKKASYLFVRFGPSFDVNLSGTEQFDSTGNKRINRDMVFSFGDYSYVTTSVNAHFGFQHKSGFTIFAHYTHGVGSLNNADYGPGIFHRVAGVSVGWKLGKK
jgi:hypothetical protein